MVPAIALIAIAEKRKTRDEVILFIENSKNVFEGRVPFGERLWLTVTQFSDRLVPCLNHRLLQTQIACQAGNS